MKIICPVCRKHPFTVEASQVGKDLACPCGSAFTLDQEMYDSASNRRLLMGMAVVVSVLVVCGLAALIMLMGGGKKKGQVDRPSAPAPVVVAVPAAPAPKPPVKAPAAALVGIPPGAIVLPGLAWSSSNVRKSPFVWAADATACITRPGSYAVRLNGSSGKARLQIRHVTAMQDGAVLASDEHDEWAGAGAAGNAFMLKIDAVRSGRPLLLLFEVSPFLGMTDSAGEVVIREGPAMLLQETFAGTSMPAGWTVACSSRPGTAVDVSDGCLTLRAAANVHAYAEHSLAPGLTTIECRMNRKNDNGGSWGPALCLFWPDGKLARINVRLAYGAPFGVDVSGSKHTEGGKLSGGGDIRLRIRLEGGQMFFDARMEDANDWQLIATCSGAAFNGSPDRVRLGKTPTSEKPGDAGAAPGSDGVVHYLMVVAYGM